MISIILMLACNGGAMDTGTCAGGFVPEDGAVVQSDPDLANPIEIVEPWLNYSCPGFPSDVLGMGSTCQTHEDCVVESSAKHESGEVYPVKGEGVCVKGLVPCDPPDVGRCSATCRTDVECNEGFTIADDNVPPMVCAIAQDQLSLCVPSECLPRIDGWDTVCGPLSGEPVNDRGVGKACDSNADCMEFPGSFCPGENTAERHCTVNCATDQDCGPNAACICTEDESCSEYNFVCAPAKDCAEAVRHHHCRGFEVPPRAHGMVCGEGSHAH
jgi:hypothetical protein